MGDSRAWAAEQEEREEKEKYRSSKQYERDRMIIPEWNRLVKRIPEMNAGCYPIGDLMWLMKQEEEDVAYRRPCSIRKEDLVRLRGLIEGPILKGKS